MVDFGGDYSIVADQIESIYTSEGLDEEYPYNLRVRMKSGQEHGYKYKTKEARSSAKRRLINAVECELRRRDADISNRLFFIDDKLKRMDGRQLRIWRLLKELVQGKVGADDAED